MRDEMDEGRDKPATYEELQAGYEHMRDLCRHAQEGWSAERRKLWAAEARIAELEGRPQPHRGGDAIANSEAVADLNLCSLRIAVERRATPKVSP